MKIGERGKIEIQRKKVDALLLLDPALYITNDEVWRKLKEELGSDEGLNRVIDFILNK